MRMLHPQGHAAPRPVDVPVLIRALGPKGAAVARELADGLFATLMLPEFAKEFSDVSYLLWGIVLDDGEDPDSQRVREAGGPGLALAYHGAYEFTTPLSSSGGRDWQAVIERRASGEHQLAVHVQHCVGLDEADQAAWDAGGYAMLEQATVSGSAEQVAARLGELAAGGVTEVVVQPCGPDIRGELETFMATARATVSA